jgi:hypothetical protein
VQKGLVGWSVPMDPQLQRLVNAGDRRPESRVTQSPWDEAAPWKRERALAAAAAVPARGALTLVREREREREGGRERERERERERDER